MIKCDNIVKIYKTGDTETTVLKGVSFEIKKGEFVAIIGPSGSGKSTLMHILGTLDRPTSGKYSLNGKDMLEMSDDELAQLEVKENKPSAEIVKKNNLLAYGATIVSIVLTESYAIYLQLGDGDILIVGENGEVTRPYTSDERLIANETTSLCSKDAWRDFRSAFQVFSGNPPALILISTDGYANSFQNEAAFEVVGTDILEMIRAQGLEKIELELETWLKEASELGSGDDITLALAYRVDKANTKWLETEDSRYSDGDNTPFATSHQIDNTVMEKLVKKRCFSKISGRKT